MSTIAEKLKIINDSCADIKEAIVAKGGTVTGNLTTYGDSIRGLQVGGSDKGRETWDVTFVDYDGTILSHYEIPMNGTVVFPDAPNHEDEGLIFDEWNCTETDASKYYDDEMYRTIVIGPIYHRSQEWEDAYYAEYNSKCAFDEYTHIYMTYPKTGVSYGLRIQPTVADGVVIDWGDGTTTTTDSTSLKLYSHTYTEIPQSKEIKVKANSGTYIFQGTSSSASSNAFVKFSDTKPDVKIGNTVTSIGNYAFNGCYGLQSVVIPSSVTSIGNYAFNGCYGLQSVVIPSSVKSIGSNAFSYCYRLQSVVIPSSVKNIDNSFYNCYGLKSVVIPSSVTSISSDTFYKCYGLICSYYGSYKMTSGCNFNLTNSQNTNHNTIYYRNIYNRQLSVKEYNGRESIDVTIPSSVTSIGIKAFYGCYGLQSITIPSTVTKIDNNSFQNCYGLKTISIPSSVKSIGSYAFYGCYGLQSITIPSSVTSIDYYAFNCCYGLQSITIPSSVTSIGSSAFQNCYGLQSITIPSTVTKIDSYAFQNCYGLQSITIPSSVTKIDSSAFYYCYGLKIVDYGNERTTVPPPPASLPTDRALRYIIVPDAVYDATYATSSWSTWKDYLIKYSDYQALLQPEQPEQPERDWSSVTVSDDSYVSLFSTNTLTLGKHNDNSTVEAVLQLQGNSPEAAQLLQYGTSGCGLKVEDYTDFYFDTYKRYSWKYNNSSVYYSTTSNSFTTKNTVRFEVSGTTAKSILNGKQITSQTNASFNNVEYDVVLKGYSSSQYTRVYGIKFYNGSELIADYIPWVDNEEYCMVDRINGTIYKPSATIQGSVKVTNDGLS